MPTAYKTPESTDWSLLQSWVTPLIEIASERKLEEDDVGPVPTSQSVPESSKIVRESWEAECRMNKDDPQMSRALLRGFTPALIFTGSFQLVFLFAQLSQPFLVGDLVEFVSNGGQGGLERGIGLALALGTAMLWHFFLLSLSFPISLLLLINSLSSLSSVLLSCYFFSLFRLLSLILLFLIYSPPSVYTLSFLVISYPSSHPFPSIL